MTKNEIEELIYQVARKSELEELQTKMYQASRGANKEMFNGLLPFLDKIEEDNYHIRQDLEYIKTLLQEKGNK
ncbi:hypothetical protein [Alteribacillus sp. YIM 98480]|uniref:hypothetical protein n=1 Tax=Alteribacillus sp. YIM 98480 TaxID=2606599 RepID=UPI00131D24D3|nr:hypothetical protein [Alteribacillus sp. YIM 98480]